MADDVKCPICGSKTRPRLAKIAGIYFHLCINYPECKGKVAFENEWEEEREEERPVTREIRPRAARTVHGSTRTNSPIKKWLIPAIGIVLVILIIVLGLYFNNANTRLSDTQNQLTTTQSQLTTTQSQLATTQSQLTTTQNELTTNRSQLIATQNQLTEAQAEITTLQTTDIGQVISAKEPLEQFLSYAISGNYPSMWNMLHPDSQKNYQGESDFASNNVIFQNYAYYTLDSYYIGSGQMLTTWGNYSNVVKIQVILVRYQNAMYNMIADLLGLSLLTGSLPAADITTWDAHLVNVGGIWKIFCERQDSSPSQKATQLVTISYTSTTASQIGSGYLAHYPNVGNVYLVVNMSISNPSSPWFYVYSGTFSVTVNNVRYNCSTASSDLSDSLIGDYAGTGGPLKGSLAFEVPAGTTAFSMNYEKDGNFNIQWVPQ